MNALTGPRQTRRFDPKLVLAAVSAAILPLIAFMGLQAASSAQSERREAEASALDSARQLTITIEARLERTRGAATALSTTATIRNADWKAAYVRAREIAELNPDWDSVVLWDPETRLAYFDTAEPFGPPKRIRPLPIPAELGSAGDMVVSGVELSGARCPCIYAHTRADSHTPLVLTVRIPPAVFQRLLLAAAEPSGVTTLIDRKGDVIARNRFYRQRFGKPASDLARGATHGPSGIYRGRTLEGFENYSAFIMSPLTGWSAHYAFAPAVLDQPTFRLLGGQGIATVAGFVIAVLLALLVVRYLEGRRQMEEQRSTTERAEAAAQLKLARDLHDGTLQFLTGAVLRMEALRRELPEVSPVRSGLDGLQAEMRREQQELRSVIERLSPADRNRSAAGIRLHEIAEALAQHWGIRISVEPADMSSLVPPALYRDIEFILRESVANAVRHADADNLQFRVSRAGSELVISIDDDGIGFPAHGDYSHDALVSTPQRPQSLFGRVENLGGRMHLSTDWSGSRIVIRLPLREMSCAS